MSLKLGRPLAALLLAAWTYVLFAVLTSTKVGEAVRFPGSQFLFNAGHAGLFGLQALLVGALLRPGPVRREAGPWLVASAVALAYSGWIELVQGGIEGRSASWADLATNTVGAFGAPWALEAGAPLVKRALLVTAGVLATATVATLTDW